jgi:hypothetical protein
MKKVLPFLLLLVVLSSCLKDDLEDLRKDVDNLKEQMAQYESLLDALNKRLYIKSYVDNNGSYSVELSDGTKLIVNEAPSFIEIGENGNWWVDGTDSGKEAADYSTSMPNIIIGDSGNWFVDGEDLGLSAKNQSFKEGSDIIALAQIGGQLSFVFADGRSINFDASAPVITLDIPEGGFAFNKMNWFDIVPSVKLDAGARYEWVWSNEVIADTKDLTFVFAQPGNYTLQFKAINDFGTRTQDVAITINDAVYKNNLTKVIEFLPAPGQFVNEIPRWIEGISADSVLKTAEKALLNNSLISLGSFGGYVTMGFDHTIVNGEGKDFLVKGNAFNNWAEPGIIMVSYDANRNGIADDEWFEIYGSEHSNPETIKNYEVTYYRPEAEPTDPNEQNYIAWKDNQGKTGFVPRNSFHKQTYFPGWTADSLTFKGTLLPSNIYDQSGNGSYWVNSAYEWGYADNWANNSEDGHIDISWAHDSEGNAVKLRGIDFVKVYNSNLAAGGWLGEVSTEISGFTDLNLQ